MRRPPALPLLLRVALLVLLVGAVGAAGSACRQAEPSRAPSKVDACEIRRPSGRVQSIDALAIDRRIDVSEPKP